MSSPFSIFKKNQRIWMAALVVLAIISFIVLPMIGSQVDNGQIMDKTVAVRWKNGTMSVDEVRRLTNSYQLSYQFLERVAREVVRAGGTPRVPGFQANGDQFQLGIDPPNSVPNVVQTRLLAQEAHKRGVNVNDATVDLYIQQLTDNKITAQRFTEIQRETAGQDLSRGELYHFIKDEISKVLLIQMQQAGLGNNRMPLVTPSNNWQNFIKFEQRAVVEVFPVFTEAFMDKVTATPTDRELREIYEKAKNQPPFPGSTEFGFMKRYSANVEYIRANLGQFTEQAKAKITPEQLQAEYDRRVAAGQYTVDDSEGELQPTDTSEPEKPATPEKTVKEKTIENDDSKPSSDEGQSAVTEEPIKSDEKTQDMLDDLQQQVEAEQQKSGAATDSGDEPTEVDAKTDDDPAQPEESQPATDDSGSAETIGRKSRLIAFQDEPDTDAAAANDSDAATANDTDAAAANDLDAAADDVVDKNADADADAEAPKVTEDDAEVASPPKDEKPPTSDDSTTTTEPTMSEEPASDNDPEKEAGADASASSDAEIKTDTPPEKSTRIQSFEEVKDALLTDMATMPARTAMETSLQKVAADMDKFRQAQQYYTDAQRAEIKDVPNPEPLNLAKLADENGLEHGDIGFVDTLSVRNFDIGKSFLFDRRTGDYAGFAQVILTPEVPLYTVYDTSFLGENNQLSTFKSWKTAEKAAYVPAFEEVRAEVEAAWKLTHAREKAGDFANELASKLNAAKQWNSVLSETDQALLIKPPSFTWLQPPRTQRVVTSLVENIGEVSNPFMIASFDTELGNFAVAPSIDEDRFFIIQPNTRMPENSVMLERFASTPMNQSVMTLDRVLLNDVSADWFAKLLDDIDFEMATE